MDTQDEIIRLLDDLSEICGNTKNKILTGTSKVDFVHNLNEIENLTKLLRACTVRHSRALGQGIKKNGEPDMRFLRNRGEINADDLRYSRNSPNHRITGP